MTRTTTDTPPPAVEPDLPGGIVSAQAILDHEQRGDTCECGQRARFWCIAEASIKLACGPHLHVAVQELMRARRVNRDTIMVGAMAGDDQ